MSAKILHRSLGVCVVFSLSEISNGDTIKKSKEKGLLEKMFALRAANSFKKSKKDTFKRLLLFFALHAANSIEKSILE